MPPATRGERPGSSRGSATGPSHSDGQAERALQVVQAAQLLGVVAVGGDHQRAGLAEAGGQPDELLELGGEGGPALARRARFSRSAASSPKSASVTGASMPAATPEAPAPGSSRSTTSTDRPRRRARQAHARPITPAPTTTAS